MAGSYPDVSSRRMAWDADGSVGGSYRIPTYASVGGNTTAFLQYSLANRQEANDEDITRWFYDGGGSAPRLHGVIFPELRDIYGFWGHSSNENSGYIHYLWTSDNTTNLIDGTWYTVTSAFQPTYLTATFATYRTNIYSMDSTAWSSGVRAIAFSEGGGSFGQSYLTSLHIYGEIAAGQTPNRLLYIENSTGLEYTLPIDWGDIPRGAVYEEEWYIKNNSSTQTANNTTISRESLYGNSHLFYTFSTEVGYSDTLGPVTSIAAGSRWPPSNALVIRNDPPSTANLGLHAARIVLDTSSWS